MIDKANIPIGNKHTKKINYRLNLDEGAWYKYEYDSRGNKTYHENSGDFWYKYEYDSYNNKIYFENSEGYIKDYR
jgi:hypothetical protein